MSASVLKYRKLQPELLRKTKTFVLVTSAPFWGSLQKNVHCVALKTTCHSIFQCLADFGNPMHKMISCYIFLSLLMILNKEELIEVFQTLFKEALLSSSQLFCF